MSAYLYGFGDPCLPTRSTVAPSGSQWVHGEVAAVTPAGAHYEIRIDGIIARASVHFGHCPFGQYRTPRPTNKNGKGAR